MNGVAENSCLVKWYFNRAFNAQCDLLRAGQPRDAKYDAKVFAPLRTRMGLGSVRVIVTGAAPMAPYLAEFLKVVSGVPVLEGYGMTEAWLVASHSTPHAQLEHSRVLQRRSALNHSRAMQARQLGTL